MEESAETQKRINEILDYIRRDQYFSSRNPTIEFPHESVEDIKKAIDFCNKLEQEDDSFEDFSELVESEISNLQRKAGNPLARRVQRLVFDGGGLSPPATIDPERLSANLTEDETFLLDAIFDEVLTGRALSLASEIRHVLFEQAASALAADLIPCGWLGKYPQGRLIVYIPQHVRANPFK